MGGHWTVETSTREGHSFSTRGDAMEFFDGYVGFLADARLPRSVFEFIVGSSFENITRRTNKSCQIANCYKIKGTFEI